jgi:hypothetical protein
LVLLLAACGEGGDGASSSTASSAVTSTTAAVTTAPAVASTTTTTAISTSTSQNAGVGDWARVPPDEAVFGGAGDQTMASVAVGGPGLVASGQDFSGGDGDAAVWTSPDGRVWSRVPTDEAVFGGAGDQAMVMVAVGGPGLVGVGYDFSGGDGDAAVWTSPDGVGWSRVPADEAVFGGSGDQVMAALAVGGPGLVAAGYDSSGGDRDAAVWTSPDGVGWSRVPADEAVFGGGADQMIWSVIAGGPGLVAVGDDVSGGDRDAAVWTSPDGVVWSRVAADEAVFGGPADQSLQAVAPGGPGLVAVGFDFSGGDQDGAVWASADGLVWSRVSVEEPVLGGAGNQFLRRVVAGGPGLVVVGADSSGGDRDGAAWHGPAG